MFSFVNKFPHRELINSELNNVNKLDIHWVLPPFGKGSGGVTTILRFVKGLEDAGHVCTIWINVLDLHNVEKNIPYKDIIMNDFFPINAVVKELPEDVEVIQGDVLIATDRYTCYPVRAMNKFNKRFYFVQDQEEQFYSLGSEYFFTIETYKFGFDCLCAGKWLEKNMREKYLNWSMSWDLSVNREIYFPTEKKQNIIPRIVCYARYVTPRRAVELLLLGLDVLAEQNIEFEVDFFGWQLPPLAVKYKYKDHGVISEVELAKLYNQGDIGVVFSATNYSLIPKEMMATGLPVVELNTESINLEFTDDVIVKVDPNPIDISSKLLKLLQDKTFRNEVAQLGFDFVKNDSWEESIKKVEKTIRERVELGAIND
jgi:glycosyltransferase involved in cell wall biosynthesis